MLRVILLLSGSFVLFVSALFAFARRDPLPPQLAATVITTSFHQPLPHYDIFLIHAESGLRRRIAYGYGMPDYVEWTPDGQWLSFYEASTYGAGRFLRVDWRGENQRTISSDGTWFSRQGPSSPDAKWKTWIGLNRTVYLYNPSDGTDALINTFGEHPQGIRSSQRLAWSADSRWLYIIDVWRYVGDRILGPDTNIIDLDYFIYRIDLDNETGDLLTSERAAALQGVEIGDDWIVYAHGSLNAESVWRMAADGTDLLPITLSTTQNLNFPLFWAMPSGDVIVLEEHISGGLRRYVFKQIDADTRAETTLTIGITSAFQAVQVPMWSPDHRYLAFIALTIDNERRLVILDEDGGMHYSAQIELCNETLPMWQDNTLLFLDHADGTCRLRQISAENGATTTLHQLPQDVSSISLIDGIEPAILKYNDSGNTTVISMEGTQAIQVAEMANSNVVAWSWLPLKSLSYTWATLLSLCCIGVALIDIRLITRKRS